MVNLREGNLADNRRSEGFAFGFGRLTRFTALMIGAAAFVSISGLPALADDTEDVPTNVLKGGVEKAGLINMPTPDLNMPAPVVPDVQSKPKKGSVNIYDEDFGKGSGVLDGGAESNRLKGSARDSGADFTKGQGMTDADNKVLEGRAELGGGDGMTGQDPDMDDAELMVEWDKWRNRFLWAVQSGVQESLNNPDDTMLRWDPARQAVVMKFPMGTVAWFACKISNDRRVEFVKLMHSSGYPNYDKAVLNAVQMLEGSSILRFPGRSRRQFVTQSAGIKTSETGGRQFFKFGDVERYRVPN